MRVRSAILSALCSVPVLTATGCLDALCKPSEEPFAVDRSVSVADVDAIMKRDRSPEQRGTEPECKEVCSYFKQKSWDAKIESCTMVLPERAEPGKPATEGRIACSGISLGPGCEGRRPLGHVEAGIEAHEDELGRSLAAMAHLEAASILAFEELAAWLEAHGAPTELVERCSAAAEDERRHARWLTHLAEERGVRVPAPVARTGRDASLLAVALHNAVEGCVHECFAALVAVVRADQAAEPRLRRTFAKIAADETRHGQLAWDLDAWLRTRLDPAQAQQVDDHRREALARLPTYARALYASTPAALRTAGITAGVVIEPPETGP